MAPTRAKAAVANFAVTPPVVIIPHTPAPPVATPVDAL